MINKGCVYKAIIIADDNAITIETNTLSRILVYSCEAVILLCVSKKDIDDHSHKE